MNDTRSFRLKAVPEGDIAPDLFDLRLETVTAIGPGELAIRALLVSVDPYLMMPIRSGAFPDGRIRSRIIARVERSEAEGFAPGDLVLGFARWQERDTVPASEMRLLKPLLPLSAYLGLAGHSGFTALLGIDILDPQPGQTVTISSAAGMVGMIAAQLARAAGARVVAIAGGGKAAALVDRFDLAGGVDHAEADFARRLAAACPQGIDRHFENVGAKILDPMMGLANKNAHIALCGMIEHYGNDAPICFANFRRVLLQSITITPFSIYSHEDRYPAALARLERMAHDGVLSAPETIHEGFDTLPTAFIAMLSGAGIGKHLVRVAE